ncbi:unnamed protein product [Pleuronectes platessa]|uniref:Uncharacterized protein n=1 Tax=Pleuronectes platessa TaxID=8262 RepID=A0A9N7UTV6_PLEPL|nr:unnamed protein product [Pleuronectes platessa]
MSRSYKIAVSQQHDRSGEWRGGWRSRPWRCSPAGERAFSPSCPAALTPLPPSGLTGRGLTGARHKPLSCPVHRRQAKIIADTCQAIQPQGQRLTDSNKLVRTMDLRQM